MRLKLLAAAAATALCAAAPAGAAPLTEDQFLVRTTADLVALCAADKADPLYTAAQNFCHGFAVGTYRAIAAVDAGTRSKRKMFCEPAKPPSRNEAIAAYVTWASADEKAMGMSPTDSILRYLAQTERCK